MKLFLDDSRQPSKCLQYMRNRLGNLVSIYSEDWYVVKNYETFVEVVEKNYKIITHISLDHAFY